MLVVSKAVSFYILKDVFYRNNLRIIVLFYIYLLLVKTKNIYLCVLNLNNKIIRI